MELAIAVMSCAYTKIRRDAIRATWLGDVPNHVVVRFFIGDSETDDAEKLKCPDTYDHCWLKQYQMIELCRDYDHVFFCDDDTYIVAQRLLSCGFESHDYMGHPIWSSEGIIHAQGGAGFWLSQNAMHKVLEIGSENPSITKTTFSDRFIGYLMHYAKIPLKPDFRFNMGKYANEKGFCNLTPNKSNSYITAHFVPVDQFAPIHDQFKDGPQLPNKYTMNFFGHEVQFSEESGIWSFSIRGVSFGKYSMAHLAEEAAAKLCQIKALMLY